MSTATVASARQSPLVPELDKGGLRPAKAHLRPPAQATFHYGELIWEVLVKGHGSTKELAFALGTDRSLLRRQILDGTLPLKKLFEADPKALAAFGEFLTEQFGDAKKSKAEIAREKLPELLALILDAVTEEK